MNRVSKTKHEKYITRKRLHHRIYILYARLSWCLSNSRPVPCTTPRASCTYIIICLFYLVNLFIIFNAISVNLIRYFKQIISIFSPTMVDKLNSRWFLVVSEDGHFKMFSNLAFHPKAPYPRVSALLYSVPIKITYYSLSIFFFWIRPCINNKKYD